MTKLILTLFCFLLALSAKSNCIDSVLIKELGMTKIHSSEIAHYYSVEKDSVFVCQLDSSLRANIGRLTKIFKHRIDSPIVIQIFPEFSYTLCVCELDSTRRTALGCTIYRKINMVSPSAKGAKEAYEIQDPMSVVVHEYAHAISFDIIGKDYRGKMKPWLREGIAFQCETNPYYKRNEDAIKWVAESLRLERVPKFKTLENKYATVKFRGVWAAWLTEFLISKYGWLAVVNMIKDYDNFPKDFGLSRNRLEKEWIEYMQIKLKTTTNKS